MTAQFAMGPAFCRGAVRSAQGPVVRQISRPELPGSTGHVFPCLFEAVDDCRNASTEAGCVLGLTGLVTTDEDQEFAARFGPEPAHPRWRSPPPVEVN